MPCGVSMHTVYTLAKVPTTIMVIQMAMIMDTKMVIQSMTVIVVIIIMMIMIHMITQTTNVTNINH